MTNVTNAEIQSRLKLKTEFLSQIRKKYKNWIEIENSGTIDEFLQYVELSNIADDDWEKRAETTKRIISEYDETYKEYKNAQLAVIKTKQKKATPEELEKLKTASKLVERFETNKEKFIELFSQYSVHNRDVAEMYYHAFLGLICRLNGKQIRTINNKLIWAIVHCFTVQDSGSGKDQGIDFVVDLAHRMNLQIAKHNKKAAEDQKIRNIRIMEISGSETMESYLDTFPVDDNGRTQLRVSEQDELLGRRIMVDADPVHGIFGNHDLIISRECSFLFRDVKTSDKQTKAEIFLQVLEGRTVPKTLNSWREDGRQFYTYTRFDGSFIGVSRPIRNMKAHLAYSGLQQRGLNICRKITIEDRNKMNDLLKDLRKRTGDEWKKVDAEKEQLVSDFVMLAKFLKTEEMPTIDEQSRMKIADLVADAINKLQNNIAQQFRNPEHRDILMSFVSRFNHHVDILAVHNALSRKSSIINDIDYQNALNLLNKSYEYLVVWVEENIEENFAVERKRESRETKLTAIFKIKPKWRLADLRKEMVARMGISMPRTYQLIQDWIAEEVVKKTTDAGEVYIEPFRKVAASPAKK